MWPPPRMLERLRGRSEHGLFTEVSHYSTKQTPALAVRQEGNHKKARKISALWQEKHFRSETRLRRVEKNSIFFHAAPSAGNGFD